MTDIFRTRLEQALRARPANHVTLDDARDAAVLIPIVAGRQPSLLFTVRAEWLPSHAGQISFPGGALEPGESPTSGALRETEEELGIVPGAVDVLGELDGFPTFVSGYVVTPVVGWIDRLPPLTPNPGEVSEVLMVDVADLSEEIRAEPGFSHGGRTYPTEAWIWDDHVIWGVTARIIRSFLMLLADARVVEPPGATSSWTGWPLPESRPTS